MKLFEKLVIIQSELNAPKSLRNNFGNYNYRSAETILEALKPILRAQSCTLKISDELVNIGERYYIKAIAELSDGTDKEVSTGFAREEETKKGMDGSQITGASSSYARKYALNGLFLIDDGQDSDATNTHDKTEKLVKKEVTQVQKLALSSKTDECPNCGTIANEENIKHGEKDGRKWHKANCECGEDYWIPDSFLSTK